jgi:hypothetical protein
MEQEGCGGGKKRLIFSILYKLEWLLLTNISTKIGLELSPMEESMTEMEWGEEQDELVGGDKNEKGGGVLVGEGKDAKKPRSTAHIPWRIYQHAPQKVGLLWRIRHRNVAWYCQVWAPTCNSVAHMRTCATEFPSHMCSIRSHIGPTKFLWRLWLHAPQKARIMWGTTV